MSSVGGYGGVSFNNLGNKKVHNLNLGGGSQSVAIADGKGGDSFASANAGNIGGGGDLASSISSLASGLQGLTGNAGGGTAPANGNNAAGGGNGNLNVVEIDDFSPEKDEPGFNHGETVAKKLEAGGGDPSLNGKVNVQRENIDNANGDATEDQKLDAISQKLDKTIQQAQQNPNSVDAVNISQQFPNDSPKTQEIRAKIDQLQQLGVPVVIAADNLGPDTNNKIAPNNGLVVQSADANGNLLNNSGPGNIAAMGNSTSYATPAVTTLAAAQKKQGVAVPQIYQNLMQQAAATTPGGVLPEAGGPEKATFTAGPTSTPFA